MVRLLNKLLSKAFFPISLKYISLIVYILLIIIGFWADSSDSKFLNQLRNTNLGNLIIWSYWWPLIVVVAIFFGRFWCMVCPVEIITTLFSKIGLRRKRPGWLKSGWAITIFYVLILFVGIHGVAIHRNPTFMSAYLLAIVGVSIIVGGIYEKNTFCQYVCPVGYLLGIYSKLSFFGWRVADKLVCETCKDKSCIHNKYLYNLNNKSCGVDLYPANIESNSDCILCAGCMKTCDKYQSEENVRRPNPQITKIGFANDLFRLQTLKTAEFVFVLIVSGFVIYEIWAEWSTSKGILLFVPKSIIEYFSISNSILAGLIKSSIIFIILPLIIWLIPFLISNLIGSTIKLKEYFLAYGISFIPIMAAAHISKAILKTTSRIPYFEHVFDDVSGISTAQKIIDKEIILSPNPIILNIIVSILITITIMIGIVISAKVVKKLNEKYNYGKQSFSYYLIPIIYGSIFLIMVLIWRWTP